MRKIIFAAIAILSISCETIRPFALTGKNTVEALEGCPEDGRCAVLIKDGQALEIQEDESGSLYYKLHPDNTKTVIIFNYQKDIPKGMQDGSYREEIVMELPNNISNMEITDFSAEGNKILFGRFCYCKGYTGYYRMDKGNLKITTQGNKADFRLSFEVNEVPQVLKAVRFGLK